MLRLFLIIALMASWQHQAVAEAKTFAVKTNSETQPGALQQLKQFLDGLKTYQADFVQTILNQDGVERESAGRFSLSRPDQFMWRYNAPNHLYILADGRWVWLVDEDLEQVTQRGQESTLAGTPAQVLASDIDIEKEFALREIGENEGLMWLELEPASSDSQFERILIGMGQGQLVRMEMLDRFGQITRFVFSNGQRNAALEPGLFIFKPPPRYDILQQDR